VLRSPVKIRERERGKHKWRERYVFAYLPSDFPDVPEVLILAPEELQALEVHGRIHRVGRSGRLPPDAFHKHLKDGAKPVEVLTHVLIWHLMGIPFQKPDIIAILEAHGFERESAERVFTLLVEKGELRPVDRGFWVFQPTENESSP